MEQEKITILHFQALEGYPPAMNIIETLVTQDVRLSVISTFGSSVEFNIGGVKYLRLGRPYKSFIHRYLSYCCYNLFSIFWLIGNRPRKILVFETLSCFPVFIYKTLFPCEVFIHFHEYESREEQQKQSLYYKFILVCQAQLLKNARWISQTNAQRLSFFSDENPRINKNVFKVMPNYPRKNWVGEIPQKKDNKDFEKIHFIHVGAIGMDSHHTQQFIEWLMMQNGSATLTFVSQNLDSNVNDYLTTLNSSWISVLPPIEYSELPKLISNYHIGLVLYNGHVPNFVYNLPNKVNEYLACGLSVWYSSDLITTRLFAEENPQYPMKEIDFRDMGTVQLPTEDSFVNFQYNHWHETAVQPLVEALLQ